MLGNKRNELSDAHIAEITEMYSSLKTNAHSKIFDKTEFGFSKVTVERQLKENRKVVKDRSGNTKPYSSLNHIKYKLYQNNGVFSFVLYYTTKYGIG